MRTWSDYSKERYKTLHDDLKVLCNAVLKVHDCKIITGIRDRETQESLYEKGFTKVHYPESKHNYSRCLKKEKSPDWIMISDAVDLVPYPNEYKNDDQCFTFGLLVKTIADILYTTGDMKHKLRWGGDWDGDTDYKDQSFNDYCHFELIP